MKHISQIDGKRYSISYSAARENGGIRYDDVTLIWSYDTPDLIGYYYGEYDYSTTEDYIKDYLNKHKESVSMDERAYEITHELNDYMTREGIGGDITPMQSQKWDRLVSEMSQLITEIEEQNKPQPTNVDLPMTYVLLIHDALQTIKKHNLNELMTDDDKDHLDEVLERFCEPLMSTNDFDNVTIDFYE